MRSFWSDPYLWVHLAGAAAVPIFLELCLVGLAASGSGLPPWFVLGVVAAAGALPILWMQWQRPFNIFSVLILALKPSELTETQRQILSRFKMPLAKGVAVAGAGGLLAVLWQLYQIAPLANSVAARVPGGWLGGLLLAAVAFLGSNLFLQVPLSVLQVLLLSDSALAATPAYPIEQIAAAFTTPGFRVKRILPLPTAELVASPPAPLTQLSEPESTDRSAPMASTSPASAMPTAPASSAEIAVASPEPVAPSLEAPEETLEETSEELLEAAATTPDLVAPSISDASVAEAVLDAISETVPEAVPEDSSAASESEQEAASTAAPTEPLTANPFPAVPLTDAFEDAESTVIDAEVIDVSDVSDVSTEATSPHPSDALSADEIDTLEDTEVIEVVEVIEVAEIEELPEAAVELPETPATPEAAEEEAEEEWDDEFFETSETSSEPAPTDPINPS